MLPAPVRTTARKKREGAGVNTAAAKGNPKNSGGPAANETAKTH